MSLFAGLLPYLEILSWFLSTQFIRHSPQVPTVSRRDATVLRHDATFLRHDATVLRHDATFLRTFVTCRKSDLRQIA